MKTIFFVAIGQNNKYVEYVSKRKKNGITTILWTSSPHLALKITDCDKFSRQTGLQHLTFELLSDELSLTK